MTQSSFEVTIAQRAGRRAVLGGMAALGIGAAFGGTRAFGQETTPAATDEGVGSSGDATGKGARYQDFVAKLAANLGINDPSTVDSAIRDALSAIVDERLAAGEIAANDATAIKEQIAASESPLRIGGFGKRGRHARGQRDDSAEDKPSATPEATAAWPGLERADQRGFRVRTPWSIRTGYELAIRKSPATQPVP